MNTIKQLYNSFIFPYIDYCLEVWGRTYLSNVNPIYVMHKKAIIIILNAHYNEHTDNYFTELNALKLFDLLKYKTGFSMYKANKNSPTKKKSLYISMSRCILDKLEINNSLTKKPLKNAYYNRWTKVVEFP